MSFLTDPLVVATNPYLHYGITQLEGQTNFSTWSRDLQAAAHHKGVWNLFDVKEGAEVRRRAPAVESL